MDVVGKLSAEIVDRISAIKGLKEARKVVVLAKTITAIASVAATSPAPAQAVAVEVTLEYVSQILAEVVETLDVASLYLEGDLKPVPGGLSGTPR